MLAFVGCSILPAKEAAPSTPASLEATVVTVPSADDSVDATVATEQETVPSSEPVIVIPEELAAILSEESAQLLAEQGCSQLVCVSSVNATAQIRFYTCDRGQWLLKEELSCTGYIGSNGVSDCKVEGDMTTPTGLYPIGEAFYIQVAPQTGLSTFQITENTYWVDDPGSAYYNQRVEGTENKDWRSAEHMIRYATAYEYGFVVNYNTEPIRNAGSAIFFHISDHSTAGCIGTDRSFVLKYLALLDSACNPYILIK
jgi:L,D-peptidoglycan transpeptidase YkuD (ErfK/YbiS/YcfS/YnhG family)